MIHREPALREAGGMGVFDHRHRAWQLVGLLRTGLGRFLVLGSGGKRQLYALATGGGTAAFGDCGGKARSVEKLDDFAGDHGVWLFLDRHINKFLRV